MKRLRNRQSAAYSPVAPVWLGHTGGARIPRHPGNTGGMPAPLAPRGTTLTEVLVSLLVMSIGVVTLATLFPISVLKSVQATQMTNATMLRYNAESMLEVFPEMVNVAPNWKEQTEYFVGNFVVDSPADGRIFQCIEVVNARANGSGLSGLGSPFSQPSSRAPGMPIDDPPGSPNLRWELVDFKQSYVIDPLGVNIIGKDNPPAAMLHNWFGNDGAGNILPMGARLRRFNFGVNTTSGYDLLNEFEAARLVTLPDSWVDQVRGFPTINGTRTGVVMPPELDLGGIPFSEDVNLNGMLDPGENVIPNSPTPVIDYGIGSSRIRITDVTGESSVSRTITNIIFNGTAWEVYWTEDVNGNNALDPGEDANGSGFLDHNILPAGAIGEVFIETRERRYSWMLTVRRAGIGTASVDVVVFFRRAFDLDEERIYSSIIGDGSNALISRVGPDGQPGAAGIDEDNNGTVDDLTELDWPGTDDRTIQVTWPATAQKPFYKRGSYLFDVGNARWYQIMDYDDASATLPANTVNLQVDQQIKYNGNRAMLMRSVIEVFPLGSKSTALVP